ncbi:hypothetical protein ACFOSE_01800 [Streptococcus dentapri]|uniref:Lipoprotein n=1 Tax=Streptococcus dentapri TaxID=573564 RepID=A0ABV8CZ53_9STRE
MTGLAACGLNKNSREWIEKNRVSDIYKVYPTKNLEDLFKVFPNGFGIRQSYTGKDGVTYELNVEGDSDTKEIKGDLVKDPIGENKKVSDVSVEGDHYIFSDSEVKTYWPIDSFLFQHLTINQSYLDKLKEKEHSYNVQSGTFSISYELQDSSVKHLLHKKKVHITDFKISGYGNNYKYYYARTLKFKFNDSSIFSESINKLYD